MDPSPIVSVVMPAHNAAPFVAQAIESILRQTMDDLELVVVNDASTDATGEIIGRFERADPRVRALSADVRSAAEARNLGLRQARGTFVALMDADDVAHADRLQKQLEAARRQPEVVLWGCYMRRITPEGLPMDPLAVGCRSVAEFERLDRTRSLVRCYGTVAWFPRELALRMGGFDRRFEPLEDSELWARLTLHGPALVVPEILQDYRQHDASLSVRKIRLQRRWYRYITARHAAWSRGQELALDEFERRSARWSWLRDLDDRMYGTSQAFGRRFRIHLARKNYLHAFGNVCLMFLSHPVRFARRLFPGAPHV